MRLQYALYGRNGKQGVVNELGLTKFADTVFLCQTDRAEKFKEFLEYWNIEFDMFTMLIPQRLISK